MVTVEVAEGKSIIVVGSVLCKGVVSKHLFYVTTYLCEKCDKTHLNIECEGNDGILRFDLTPHIAEQLAEDLINPQAMTKIRDEQ